MRFESTWMQRAAMGRAAVAALVIAAATNCGKPAQDEDRAPAVDTVQGPAGSLHVDDGGSGGLPVVFVHSFGGDSSHWREQLTHLRATRRAVALDLRAHGKSAAPATGEYSVDAFASDIDAVVNELGLDHFVLVGHSLGGAAALDYASNHPDRIAGLVLVAAPGRTPPEQAQQILNALETDYETVMQSYWDKLLVDARPEVRSQVRAGMSNVPKPVALAIIRELMQTDPLPALGKYTGPKLAVVTPANDNPTDLQNLVPGFPHAVVAGTSHWLQMDKAEEFDRILDDFLAKIPVS